MAKAQPAASTASKIIFGTAAALIIFLLFCMFFAFPHEDAKIRETSREQAQTSKALDKLEEQAKNGQ